MNVRSVLNAAGGVMGGASGATGLGTAISPGLPCPAGDGYAVQATPCGCTVARMPVGRVEPGPGDAVVRVICCTICEADRRFTGGSKVVDGRPPALVLGHEAVGEVVRSGASSGVRVGDIVAVMPHIVRDSEHDRPAFKVGEIFKCRTHHAGMGVDGTMGQFVVWPGECLRAFSPETIEEARQRAAELDVHWSVPLAETEHLACVFTALDHAERSDRHLGGTTFAEFATAGSNPVIAIVGAGWMGYLNYLVLHRRFPNARIVIREPDERRQRAFRDLCAAVGGEAPALIHPEQTDFDSAVGLTVVATSARAAVTESFRWMRPGGHVMLFSGIHDGGVNPLFDPAGLANLERIHRDGKSAVLYRTDAADPADTVVASGSSGYANRCFDQAVTQAMSYYDDIGAGITGVVMGIFADELVGLRTGSPGFKTRDGGPVMPALISTDWPGRLDHFKVALHPVVTDDVRAAYRAKWGAR